MKTDFFEAISLEGMDQVKLMNRLDRKFWFHLDKLEELLASISQQYYILEIDGKREMSYASTYFDTPRDKMYTTHHNGKLNRFKIRKRSYVNTGISFLEIKHKNNKGRTIKKRIKSKTDLNNFSVIEDEFIESNSPYNANNLQISLINGFSRITLVNKNFKERCTIDFNLKYKIEDKEINLDDLVIVEVKADSGRSKSAMVNALNTLRIKPKGFSKYCIGRSLTDPKVKINAFKERIRLIEKLLHRENISLNFN